MAAKAQTIPLTSPVSLLWAHQLRRENAALLERINVLANSVSNVSATQINKIATQAKKAEEKSNQTTVEVGKLRKAAEVDRKKVETVKANTHSALAKLEASAPDMQLQDRMNDVEERLENTVSSQLERVGRALEVKLNGQDFKFTQLHERVRDLEDRLLQFGKEGETVVQGSVEQMRDHAKPIADGRPREHRDQSDAIPARVSSRLQAQEHVEEPPDEQMLTQHLRRSLRNNETPLGDIDLDETSSSNLVGQPRCCESEARETMAMISKLTPSQLHQQKDPSSLKQGKFQSMCDYMVAGQVFVDATPKRKESAVVEAFVDGMHNTRQKMRFESRLDKRGWIWDNVNDVAREILAEEAETQRKTQLASPGPVRLEAGQTTTGCGHSGSETGASGTVPAEVCVLPPGHARSKVAATPPRRSQRIREASQARTADAGKGNAISTRRAPEMVITSEHVRETGEKSKWVTLMTPNKTQHQNTTSIRGTSAEMVRSTPCSRCNLHEPCTKCASTDLTYIRPSDAPPQQDETVNGNGIKEQMERAGNRAKEEAQKLNVVTNAMAQQPQGDEPHLQPNSKKRSRECGVEVQSKPGDGVKAPLRQYSSGSRMGSPKQKRRKRRRAVSPIPMIPILPLTDEED